ncbi:MAG: hypothetical protein GXP63_01760 [DPANN group archaeon]|nr:hypothetical protein [DPANN group archaeon]
MKWIRIGRGFTLSLVIGIFLLSLFAIWTVADPVGPTLNYISHSSGSSATGSLADNSSHTGGVIAKMNLDVRQQNPHWKAYVGNISGNLVLEDGFNYSIYEWSLTSLQGEVYATRASSITWGSLTCANISQLDIEMAAMNHTPSYTLVDNISATFDDDANSHAQFYAGSTNIAANSCDFSTNLYANDTAQSAGGSTWEEVVLFQQSNNATVYTSIIDENNYGYANGSFFDYEILLPEKGEPTFTGATPYYFYVELV